MSKPPPNWYRYTNLETKAARRSTHLPGDLLARLTYLANVIGLTPGQKAKLTHRSPGWLDQFKTEPVAPLDLTFDDARALYHLIGWNKLSYPFLAEQVSAGWGERAIQQEWGITTIARTRKAITNVMRGNKIWW